MNTPLNQLFNNKAASEKTAAENSGAVQRVLAKIAIAANRDEKAAISQAKTAAATGEGVAAERDDDKFHAVLEGAKALAAGNPMKPAEVHVVGADEGTDAMAAATDDALKTASFLAVVRHVKTAANREALLAPVPCFVCNTAGAKTAAEGKQFCGVCDHLGHMPKFAAERGAAFADQMSDFIAAKALAKEAGEVMQAVGKDSIDFQAAQAEAMQASQVIDANFQTMLSGKPPQGSPDWGGQHISQNTVWTMLQPTIGHTY